MTALPATDPSAATGSFEAFATGIAELLEIGKPIRQSTNLVDDLALDSLDLLELLDHLAGQGIDLPDRVFADISTAGELYDLTRACPRVAPRPRRVQHAVGGPSALRGTWTALRPVLPNDTGWLYGLATDEQVAYRWRYRGTVPPIEQFQAQLWHGVLAQYIALRTADGEPIGLVVAYEADVSNGHASIAAVFAPEVVGTGLGAEAVELLVRHVFATYNLEKVYFDVPEYNLPQFSSLARRHAVQEGRLGRHLYYGGRHWDAYLFAIYRDAVYGNADTTGTEPDARTTDLREHA